MFEKKNRKMVAIIKILIFQSNGIQNGHRPPNSEFKILFFAYNSIVKKA